MATAMMALAWVVWGLGAFVLVKALLSLARDQRAAAAGLIPASYIVLSLCIWVTETNLVRLVGARLSPAEAAWAPFTLWWPPRVLSRWPSLSWGHKPQLLLLTLILALSVAVTLNFLRLRNAALPVWIALLALIPFVNFALFVFLSLVPARTPDIRLSAWSDYLLPRDPLGSAVVSCLITAVLGVIFFQFGTSYLGTYGWVLFTLIPVVMGFSAAAVYGFSEPRTSSACVSVALASAVIGGLAMVGIAIEGAVCILMAAPLALPLAAFGGWLGYLVQRRRNEAARTPQIAGALLVFLPFMMYGEQRSRTGARQIQVSTSIVIHAPANRVWQSVISLDSVPKPNSILFESIAYPIRTSLEGTGLGAKRQCVFSTGSIVEPIEVWNPGHELRFSVVSQPPLMREVTPYSDVHPPHLKLEYLRSEEGRFTLTAQGDGSTLLTGTSYYESRLWPGTYWQLWTDAIAHRVHHVVLEEIKKQSEL